MPTKVLRTIAHITIGYFAFIGACTYYMVSFTNRGDAIMDAINGKTQRTEPVKARPDKTN